MSVSSSAKHRASRRAPLRSMLTVTSAVAGITLIGLGAAGTTFALWTDSARLNAPTVSSGSLDLTVNDVRTFALPGGTAGWTKMLPGDRKTYAVTVKNTGTVGATVEAISTPSQGAIEVRVKQAACTPSVPIGGPSSTVEPTSLPTWAAGQSRIVCIEVSLSPSAVENRTENIAVTFVATQLTP